MSEYTCLFKIEFFLFSGGLDSCGIRTTGRDDGFGVHFGFLFLYQIRK